MSDDSEIERIKWASASFFFHQIECGKILKGLPLMGILHTGSLKLGITKGQQNGLPCWWSNNLDFLEFPGSSGGP